MVAPIDGTSTLWMVSYDAAGNVSVPSSVALQDASGSLAGTAPTPAHHAWLFGVSGGSLSSPIPDQNTDPTAADTSGAKPLVVGSAISLTTTDAINSVDAVPVLAFSGGTTTASLVGTVVGTGAAAVDTTSSFTAEAWVKPAAAGQSGVILAQSGSTRSGFLLEETAGSMQFCIQPQGSGQTGTVCATATRPSPGGQWTLVTGIYDAVNKRLRALVDNDVTSVGWASIDPSQNATPAAGQVTVGSAQASSGLSSPWHGEIVNPVLAQVVFGSAAIGDNFSRFPQF